MSVSVHVQNQIEHQLVNNLAYIDTPCILVHHTGRIVGCNTEFLTTSSYERKQLEGFNAYKDLFVEIENMEQLQKTLTGNKEIMVEWKGGNHPRLNRIQPFFIPNEQNLIHYAYLQFLNRTDNQQLISFFAEQLFTYSHLALLLLDPNGKVLSMTKAAAEIIGGEVEEYIGQNILEYFSTLPFNKRLIQKSFFREISIRNKVMMWDDGQTERELLLDSFPIYDQDHNWIGVSVFVKDVTNVRILEDQIRRRDRLAMIGQVAAGTAHEIRNPLTSIKGFLQVMKKTLEDHQFTKEVHYTEIMLEEIERINHLLGEFLLLSRSKETKHEIISLNELMHQFLPVVSNEALIKGIEVEHVDLAGLPKVIGNKDLLKQVFLNICKNAIESIQDTGQIQISYQVDLQQKMIKIHFQDNGPGIPAHFQDKIFDPFFTTKEDGTGLGLSVCHRIIHDMGGEIAVFSTDEQTVFTVLIPYIES